MTRKQKSIEELILESFEGSRHVASFKHFTNDEFIGYVTATTKLQNPSHEASVKEILDEVRRLTNARRL